MTSAGSMQEPASLDSIRITSIQAFGHHGVLESERRDGQEFTVDLTLHLALGDAAEHDDLEQTVNYAHVAQAVQSVIEGPAVNLIETVAERVAAIVMEDARVQAVEVTVHKPSAPIPVPFGSVDVTITRSRTNPPRVARPFVEVGAAAVETLPDWSEVDPAVQVDPVQADPHREDDTAPADSAVFAAEPAMVTAPDPELAVAHAEGEFAEDEADVFEPEPTETVEAEETEFEDAEFGDTEFENAELENAELENAELAAADSEEVQSEEAEPEDAVESEEAEFDETQPEIADLDGTESADTELEETQPESTEPESIGTESIASESPEDTESENAEPENATAVEDSEPLAAESLGASQFWHSETPTIQRTSPTLSELLGGDPNEPLDLSKPLFATAIVPNDAPLPSPFFSAGAPQNSVRATPQPETDEDAAPYAPTYDFADADTEAADAEQILVPELEPELEAEPELAPEPELEPEQETDSSQLPAEALAFEIPALESDDPAEAFESSSTEVTQIVENQDFADQTAGENASDDENTQILPVYGTPADAADLTRGGTAIFEPVRAERPQPQPVSPNVALNAPVFAMHDVLDETPEAPVKVVLAIGGNVGDAVRTMSEAVRDLRETLGFTVVEVGPLARTAAVGGPEQDDFYNSVILGETTLSPRELLRATQAIEKAHHRTREVHWGPRTLDIDIITYGSLVASSEDLTIPHPRANERAFVLVPWAQADSEAQLPGLGGGPVSALAATAPDREGVRWLALDWLTN